MIAHLSGTLRAKHATSVIVDVGGVGYEVTIPVTTFYDLGEPPSAPVQLHVYTHVREDALHLFGFRTLRERELFTQLISVSGIGPKSAVAMLSGMSADEIVTAIRTNNYARLTSIPGVGRKTAERLVIELRDRLATLADAQTEEEILAAPAQAAAQTVRDDTISALLSLGYQRSQAEKAVARVLEQGQDQSIEQVLRQSLKLLSR